jgi:carbamoylphosphate synthase large subunit
MATALTSVNNEVLELCHFAHRRILSLLSPKLRILFSKKDDWEPAIRNGFRYTGHQLSFEDFSLEQVKNHDVVVPLLIKDIKMLNEIRQAVINNPIPIPTLDSLCLCDDKEKFIKTLSENNFGAYLPKQANESNYPYILKKKIDEWGVNSYIILNAQEEQKFAEKLSSPEYFTQQLIPGRIEYATHMLYSKGRPANALTIEYQFETKFYVKGKDRPVFIKKAPHNQYLNIFSAILDLIEFEGLCCLNYKTIDNRPILFEINPRFGGSLSPYFYSFIRRLI